MNSGDIRKAFLSFFESRAHAIVPSSSLVPDDPSVLLTTAGMQQFKKYYTGELDAVADFGLKNTASIQKCFRTSDIDEVGDESHLTFFEMLGNFSFGGYFKEKAIQYGYEFITESMHLPIDMVTYFDPAEVSAGDWRKGVPKDTESRDIWRRLGVPEEKIVAKGVDNFWGPTGSEGPCGPTTELYVKTVDGKSVEIWNIVFNEYYCAGDKQLEKLKTPGVDTGMGLERLAMVSQGVATIFETDLLDTLTKWIPGLPDEKHKRVVADHARGIAFLFADGVVPSNKGAGYVLRRLMRRMLAYESMFKTESSFSETILQHIAGKYRDAYPLLSERSSYMMNAIIEERERFSAALNRGLKELERTRDFSASGAFMLYESYGLPYEIIKEVGREKARALTREDFDRAFEKHQEVSRAGVEKKFGGHGLLLDTGELKAGSEAELQKVTRLHTATHLLQQALRDVLGESVGQMGSDITVERTRFDFTFPRKLTPEEIARVEARVNAKVVQNIPVSFIEMSKSEAEKTGALHFFKVKYPEQVTVYYVGESLENAYSKEFCGGPHVSHTGEIGTFKIMKEEAVAAGVRRIRARVG